MKTAILFFLISLKVFALDDSIFADRYPTYAEYQSQAILGLSNYFYSLNSKSIVVQGKNNLYQYLFNNDAGVTLATINIQIERTSSIDQLTETVHFVLPNSEHFDYTLTTHGKNIEPTKDIDLLTFRFSPRGPYELVIAQLKSFFQKSDLKTSSINLGIMEISIAMETVMSEVEGIRNYIYFYRGMPNPQSMLSVRVVKENQNFRFIHFSKGVEITPKMFFQGVQEGSQLFSEYSDVSLQALLQLGFPAIKGVN